MSENASRLWLGFVGGMLGAVVIAGIAYQFYLPQLEAKIISDQAARIAGGL